MKILAFDTAAKVATVAVLDGDRVLGCYSINNGLTQSELIMPMAENMLSSLGLSLSDIELFACSAGPGSFTGVRIGVSLVKGLSFGRNIPTAGVSTLLAIAENLSGLSGVIVPVMDARRGEVYTASFVSDGNRLERTAPDRAIPIKQLGEELSLIKDKKIYLAGDGYGVAHKALSEMGLRVENTPLLLRDENAASVGIVAYRAYMNGEYTADTELSPIYLRVPQAERERLERLDAAK